MSVHISPGLRLSDDNARAFSRHMLDELRLIDERAMRLLKNTTDANHRTSLFNRIGQQRWWKRFLKAQQGVVLSQGLRPGKKGHFTAACVVWRVSDSNRLVVSKIVFLNDDETRADCKGWDLLEFSEHAVMRLIQRSGISMADDYFPLLRDLAEPCLLINAAESDTDIIADDEVWPLPVTVGGIKSLLLIRNMWEGDKRVPLVTTVFKGTWRDHPELVELENELAKSGRERIDTVKLAKLFRAAGRYFK